MCKVLRFVWTVFKAKRWEEYKVFFQVNIFKYLVLWFTLVPIFAGLIEQFRGPFNLSIGDNNISFELFLPFNWQLLWMSSLCFVIALLIYSIHCPKFIRKYNNYSDYLGYAHDSRWLAHEMENFILSATKDQVKKLVHRLQVKGFIEQLEDDFKLPIENPEVQSLQTVFYFESGGTKYGFGAPLLKMEKSDSDFETGAFYELFGRFSGGRPIARWAIDLFLWLCLIFFLIAFSQHIYNGGLFVWSWISA